MEKFSAFRDPGTGIQPFLKPVPPLGSETLAYLALPFGYVVGAIRLSLIVVLGLLYALVVRGFCPVLIVVPPLYRLVTQFLTALICRLVLLLIGLWWIPVDVVARKRGRSQKLSEDWNPQAGDIIVSNWVSFVEILWLAFRFNPVFVLPIRSSADTTSPASESLASPVRTPGRRTGTGSAALSLPSARAPSPRVPIRGFRRASLLSMLRATGHVPISAQPGTAELEKLLSMEEIRNKADRPVVVFPECTTSNGRGLLRFAEIFREVKVPVTKFNVFVMCVRYDPPTALQPTLTHSIPSTVINPLPHLLTLAMSLAPLTVSIRLLAPSESPSSRAFLASEYVTGEQPVDLLSEACTSLIAHTGKMKRLGMGWEDKVAFLDFYNGKKK
ncbi:hypothetical protein SCP_0207780 [Sparassis crispa]|uniref:Phospholipid/glycerol acyltransferase domain-containing protein n=1 Tax=Sparassis crispa TaxID=139825 RepID=A0A401GBM6_9APHY|nr:hypothetical protein SCP_0207780 [Sparassis crispa]GBE79578.1 hypothetical protein SCP_0207780 [Sparassis crispa]